MRAAELAVRASEAVQPSNFTFNATMSACEKGQQWPWALELFKESPSSSNTLSHSHGSGDKR